MEEQQISEEPLVPDEQQVPEKRTGPSKGLVMGLIIGGVVLLGIIVVVILLVLDFYDKEEEGMQAKIGDTVEIPTATVTPRATATPVPQNAAVSPDFGQPVDAIPTPLLEPMKTFSDDEGLVTFTYPASVTFLPERTAEPVRVVFEDGDDSMKVIVVRNTLGNKLLGAFWQMYGNEGNEGCVESSARDQLGSSIGGVEGRLIVTGPAAVGFETCTGGNQGTVFALSPKEDFYVEVHADAFVDSDKLHNILDSMTFTE